jgi:hypothetical protein
MARPLFYLGDHFFGLIYLFFRSLIPSSNGFGNYTKLRIRPNVLIVDLGLLS